MSHHLVGVREIAELLLVSRQRADQLTRTKGFPDPVIELAAGRVWEKEAVLQSVTSHLSPSEIVKGELSLLPKGQKASALSVYRMVYAVIREKGLGRHAEGVPGTREFAHERAVAEARRVDPGFEVTLPAIG